MADSLPVPEPIARRPAGRRGFLRAALSELAARVDAVRGEPQYRRADLWDLSDAQLATLRPVIDPTVILDVTDEAVWWHSAAGADPEVLFARTEVNNRMFNAFDGRSTIADIARAVAVDHGGEAASFARVRALFLDLADKGVCAPAPDVSGAIEPPAAPGADRSRADRG